MKNRGVPPRCSVGPESANPGGALLVEGDPTELVDITPLIPADYAAERSRILSRAELLELHNRFQQMTADYNALPAGQKYEGIRPLKEKTQLALWSSLGTLCRIENIHRSNYPCFPGQ